MKKLILLTLMLFLAQPAGAHTQSEKIFIAKDGFNPKQLIIDINSTIEFINDDSNEHWPASDIHPTHRIYPEFDPKNGLKNQESFRFKFEKAGKFKYHDHLNPKLTGVIEVLDENKVVNQSKMGFLRYLIDKMFIFFANLRKKISPEGTLSFRPKKIEIISKKQIDDIVQKSQLSLMDKSQGQNEYIKKQMETCFKSGGRDYCYKDLSYLLMYQFGLREVLDLLYKNENDNNVFARCHELTHYLTRLAYQQEKSIASVYDQCSSVCHGGCYHGAIEQYLEDQNLKLDGSDEEKIKLEVPKICGRQSDFEVPLLYTECLHGIGHGGMFITDGDLFKALKMCDFLRDEEDRQSCYSGAFMENSSSSTNLDHPSRFIKDDDPLYPCNALEEKYLSICYRYQSSYFAIKVGSNWVETAKLCMRVPDPYKNMCFLTIGSNQVGFTQDLDLISQNCSLMPEDRFKIDCIKGAVDGLAIRYRNDPLRGFNLCQKSQDITTKDCFIQYGSSILSWSSDVAQRDKLCDSLKNLKHSSWCKGIEKI